MQERDAVIIGGGPAGLAAAVRLKKLGIDDIVIIEREKQLGGILRQCIHDGFGLTRFKESLSGPEYAQRFIDSVESFQIEVLKNATVLNLSSDKVVTIVTRSGLIQMHAKAVILTMGCRERTRGALAIPGSRPSGVMTAGVAQSYINLHNTMVGKEVIILGSGDIGMIMARRLTLEGAHVIAVFEVLPYPSGLPRNIEQCLNDYDIPLFLGETVVNIKGESRIQAITVMKVDDRMKPIPGTERDLSCDTLILSVGLIPENELSQNAGVILDERTKGAVVDEYFQTNIPGIFAAGNVLHVHDLVDFVSLEAESLAENAANFIKQGSLPECNVKVETDKNIGHVIPQYVSGLNDIQVSLRVRRPYRKCTISVTQNGRTIKTIRLHKAIPAEMIQFIVKSSTLSNEGNIMVAISE